MTVFVFELPGQIRNKTVIPQFLLSIINSTSEMTYIVSGGALNITHCRCLDKCEVLVIDRTNPLRLLI